jgi:hypothetical protein
VVRYSIPKNRKNKEAYMNALVIVARGGKVEDVVVISEKALEGAFLSVCGNVFSNFGDYTRGDIDAILEDGYAEGSDVAVCMHHPHAEPDAKTLVIRLDENILNDVLVYNSMSAAKKAFVDLAFELATDHKDGVTKKELKAVDSYSSKGTTIQIYQTERE